MLVQILTATFRTLIPNSFGDLLIYAILVSTVVIYVKSLKRDKEWLTLPGPTPWPLVGNAPFLGPEPHKKLLELSLKYGPVYRLKMGGIKTVVLCNAEVVRSALIKQREAFSGRPKFSSYKAVSAGESVVFNDEETLPPWRSHKSKIVRHMHKYSTSIRTRDKVTDLINTECMMMVTELDRISRSKCVNPENVIRMALANVMCAVCFGNRFEYDNEEYQKLLSMNSEFSAVIELGPIIDAMPWIKVIPKFKKAIADYLKINLQLDTWSRHRVDEVLKTFDNDDVTNVVASMTSEVLEKKSAGESREITESETKTIAALSADILGAGQHTTSTTFFWVINLLLCFPKVLHKLTEEVRSKLGNRLPTLEDRKSLPYVEAVLTEVLRFSSPLSSTIPHSTLKDVKLAGYTIKRGTMVIISQYAVNHDPQNWKNPENFDPERFLTKNEDGKIFFDESLSEKVLAFSIGERKCPGSQLSRMLLFLATALLVQVSDLSADLERPPTAAAEYGLMLRPKHLSLKLTLREHWQRRDSVRA
ncbi:cytochrome P450 1B1-like [Ciona intestinalis]